MPSLATTLDSNVQGTSTSELALTTETVITLFVCESAGRNQMVRIGIEVSPEASGDHWCPIGVPINGNGTETVIVSAARARAVIHEAEGATATIYVSLVAH